MTKITALFISLVLICVALMGCNAKDAPSETASSLSSTELSAASMPSKDVAPSALDKTNEDSTIVLETDSGLKPKESTTDLSTTDDPSHLIWTVARQPYISNEARTEINRFLHEKGIECEIEFVDVEGGAYYRKWYEQQKQKDIIPDILAVSPWERGIYDAVEFIRSELLPLNDYLDTEEGKILLDSYCDLEWKQLTIDGNIYTVPKRMRLRPYDMFIYVNDRYKDAFEASFDGSYESLRKICEESEEHPIIACYSLGANALCPFLGYSLKNKLFYDMDLGIFADLLQDDRLKGFLQEVYNDMQKGQFVSWASSDILSENVLAYISFDQSDDSYTGYTQYVLSPYRFMTDPGSFGICASSTKPELAFQVLSACFSDSRIASLIGYGEVSVEEWNEETEVINSHTADKVTGFMPELSIEEIEQLYQIGDEITRFVSDMISSRDPVTGIGIVNPNYPSILEEYFATSKDYGEIYDKINRQLEEWTKQK
ncbi:MAG: hypothetical protein IK125_00615 [Lachnospiraceae bacterium]|nr:hypothetical protein [Lachnospiraceae bacterium]